MSSARPSGVGGNFVAITRSLPSASSPSRRSEPPALYIAAVSKKLISAATVASKAACSSAAFVPPYELFAGITRCTPLASPQTMTPNPSRETRTSLRPSGTVSAIWILLTRSMNAPAVDQLISASDLRAAPQRNSDSSVPVSSSNKPEEERSMGITRLNHAVLFVRDLERSVAFYTEVLRFRRIDMTPEGFAGAAFLQAPGSNNDHDLGLFEIGANAGPAGAGRTTVGLYHLAWEIDTLAEMKQLAASLAENDALAGSSDHGTTKSLYGKDPDGLEFEIAWIVPADRLDEAARQARKQIGRLDLDREIARYGADTRGGIGISVPIG